MRENVQNRIRFGPYEADLRTHELWKEGVRLKLAGQPFQVLEMLLERPGELVTRDELRLRMWPEDTFVDFSHGLNAAVNKLREALSDSAENPKYIETLPRRGYRFIAEAQPVSPKAPEPVTPVPVPAPTPVHPPVQETEALPTLGSVAPEKPAKPRRWLRRTLFGVAGLFVLVIVAAVVIIGIVIAARMKENQGGPEALMQARSPLSLRLSDPVIDPDLSPDGTLLAVTRLGRSPSTTGIFIKRLGTDELIQLTRGDGDCCATFSPDGKSVALARESEKAFEIFVISIDGGNEKKVFAGRPRERNGELDWSPDGKSLVFSESSANGSHAIVSLSLETSQLERLTKPAPGEFDHLPAYSPDGKFMAFVRGRNEQMAEDILLLTPDGTIQTVKPAAGRVLGPPAWAADSRSIVYSVANERGPQMQRISLDGTIQVLPVPFAGQDISHPTISRRGYRMAFEQQVSTTSLWRQVLEDRNVDSSRTAIVQTDGKNEAPQLSPDGKHLAFMSDRSGSTEIWISAADGSNPIQLSALGKAGTPRWSPDSKQIAFDSDAHGRAAIYIVNADGGEPKAVVQGDFDARVPSWSHDGKSLYFASDRGHGWQVWKQTLDTGDEQQLTRGGGFAAWESADGKYIYYSKHLAPDPTIWRASVSGGDEKLVSTQLVPRIWAAWALAPNGIYFIPESSISSPAIRYFDFATQDIRTVVRMENYPFWLSVSPDGKTLFFDQTDKYTGTVNVVENFH